MDEVDGLMMNAFSVTTKKKFDNGKINYGTVSKPPQNKLGGETGVGREKGRALQSKTLPENFFGSKIVSPCLQPDSAKPQPGEVHATR